MMLSEETRQFIRRYADADTAELLLKRGQFPGLDVPFAVQQIEGRRKAQYKLPALASNPDFVFPPRLNLEQASSEPTAEFKAARYAEGATVIDITGGLGIDSIYFARRAAKVTYIEQNPELFAIARQNFDTLGLKNVECFCGDSLEIIAKQGLKADLVYADPARRDEHNRKMVSLADCTPDITALLPALLKAASQVLVKTSPMLDITLAQRQLGCVAETAVVSVRNECKEVLFLCGGEKGQGVVCADIDAEGRQRVFVPTAEELASTPPCADRLCRYLYDPGVSVVKANVCNALAMRMGLAKLHHGNRLLTSDVLVDDFPGRVFEVRGEVRLSAKEVREALPQGKANVVCRSFPQTADELRKKLKLSDGGDDFLVATTIKNNKKIGIVCRKVGERDTESC
ncbi:MAG: RsmD family RNA methyltransferase [Bacteroidales bacterium]|nr:RsmD family RNA methyltransferase [Bacteroidales bacterium]